MEKEHVAELARKIFNGEPLKQQEEANAVYMLTCHMIEEKDWVEPEKAERIRRARNVLANSLQTPQLKFTRYFIPS